MEIEMKKTTEISWPVILLSFWRGTRLAVLHLVFFEVVAPHGGRL